MKIAQYIAAHAVAEVLDGHNLTVSLPKAQNQFKQATPQQLAGAQHLSYQTLRVYAQVAAVLQALTPKPVSDKRVNALLLVALAQLIYDDEDAFTVVNQAVEAAGRLRLRWAKGLVNAVLRQFLRQQSQVLNQIAGSETVAYNYPQWWIASLKQQYPQHWQAMLTQGNQHPPMTLRVNQRRCAPAEYFSLLQQAGINADDLGGGAIRLHKPLPVQALPGFAQGLCSVQDAAAQWAASLLDVQSGMRVLDACSAPGGKTGHVLEICDVDLTALDVDAMRLKRVHDNLQRLGLQAKVLQGDAAQSDWFNGKLFDRIIADVPCSASGIVRRHVDMKWLRRPQDIALFARQQQQILSNLWQMLAKGGKLLYVTCSVFQQENEMQIQPFLEAHHEAKRLPLAVKQSGLPSTFVTEGQLLPTPNHDGLFYALLEKQ